MSHATPGRAALLVLLPAVTLAVTACSSGSTSSAPPSGAAQSPAASARPTAPPGFPSRDDGAVLTAARQFVEKVTTYDDAKLNDQLNAVLPLTGEPLKGELRTSLAEDGEFATATRENERDAKGTVVDLGLVQREGNRAVVVAFVDQQITSPAGETTQRLRQRVTLNQARGAWLAVKLETV